MIKVIYMRIIYDFKRFVIVRMWLQLAGEPHIEAKPVIELICFPGQSVGWRQTVVYVWLIVAVYTGRNVYHRLSNVPLGNDEV